MWWRMKHHPFRDSAVERRTRRIAWVCRPAALLFAVVAMFSWSEGTRAAEWIGVALGIAGAFLMWFSLSSHQKAKHNLRSTRLLDQNSAALYGSETASNNQALQD
jgi:peptidoglycan/LPS O-acetylase OafA/YrhL